MRAFLAALLLALALGTPLHGGAQTPVTNTFTYQGQLRFDGQPANGTYSLRFRLYDAETGGNQLGLFNQFSGLTLVDGLVNVRLSFLNFQPAGQRLWLDIEVSNDGNVTFTPLTPRQEVTAAVYALHALAAEEASVAGPGAVTTASVVDGAITAGKLAAGAVGTNQIANASITSADLAANSVGGAQVANGAITDIDVATDTLTAQSIATNAIGADELAAGAVGSAEIADSSIVDADIAANSILGVSIAADTLTAADIAPSAIGTSELANGVVTQAKLALNAVGSPEVIDGSIGAADVDLGQVQARLQANCPSGLRLRGVDAAGAPLCDNTGTTLGFAIPFHTEMALNADGNATVLFADDENTTVGTARLLRIVCLQRACDARTTAVLTNDAGAFAIERRPFGTPHYAFVRLTGPSTYDLVIVRCLGAQCQPGTPNVLETRNDGRFGLGLAIAFRADGRPVLSWYGNAGNAGRGLRFYSCADIDCTSGSLVALDARATVSGTDTAIAVRSNGRPLVAYRENGQLRLYDCTDAACTSGTIRVPIANAPLYDEGIELRVRPNGLPIVAYASATLVGASLVVYDCTNADCSAGTQRTVAESSSSGMRMALRADGRPTFATIDEFPSRLSLRTCANVGCTSSTVELVDGAELERPGLGIGTDDRPVLGYRRVDGMRVHACGNPTCDVP